MASPAALLRSLFAALVLFVSSVSAYTGQGTAYGPAGGRGAGACEITSNQGIFETYYAAMNHAQYGGSCGKCIEVCGRAGCRVLKVLDMCPGCGFGDVDMSSVALQETTGYAWDRKPISWNYVSCGGGSSTSSVSRGRNSGGSGGSRKKRCKCRRGRRGRKCRRRCRRGY